MLFIKLMKRRVRRFSMVNEGVGVAFQVISTNNCE